MAFASGLFFVKDVQVDYEPSTQAVQTTTVTLVTAVDSDPAFFPQAQTFQIKLKGGGYPITPGGQISLDLTA